jgi:hypothetical protein
VPETARADSPCPQLAELILASEGELPKRRQHEVSTHIRHCPTCRETLGRADRCLAEFQDAHETPQLRAAEAVAAAERANDFRTRLRQEQRVQLAHQTRFPVRSWLPVAAAVPVLVAALFFSNRYSVIVRAEELLTRAVAQEQAAPAGTVRRVQIRVNPTRHAGAPGHSNRTAWSMTRELGLTRPLSTSPASTNSDHDELAALLTANHFDWQDPLSVRAFRTWRDSLANKTDSVTLADTDSLALRTTTPDGILRSATLIVRRVDFQPIKETLNFEGFGEVEIVELSRWVSTNGTIAERTMSPSATAPMAAPSADILDQAELDARKTLHEMSLDWNPAIAVSRSDRAVEVRGRIDAQHKAQIAQALSKVASVRVMLRSEGERGGNAHPGERNPTENDLANGAAESASAAFTTPSVTAAGTDLPSDTPRNPLVADQPPLQRWLERTFGHGERSTTFIPGLTAAGEQVQRRTTAFAALAARYPESEVRRLSGPARKKLEALADAQYRELVKAVEDLDDRLALFLGTTTRRAAADSPPRSWQTCAAALTAPSARLNRAISSLLSESDLPLPTEIEPGRDEPPAFANLRQASDTLWEQLHP